MGRPKGSKNKPKPECHPPPVRDEPDTVAPEEVFDARIVVVSKKGDRLDGAYIVGKMPSGKNYVAKMCYLDLVPITSELRKKLGIE
jgi:hypothetical protein